MQTIKLVVNFMWSIYFLAIILLILFVVIFVFPVRIEICEHIYPIYPKIFKYKSRSIEKKHFVKIKILKIITVYKIDLDKKKQEKYFKKTFKNTSNDPVELVINAVFNFLDNMITSTKVNKALLSSKDFNRILDSVYVKKLDLEIGINLVNVLVNVYVNALFNSLINMIISKRRNHFNFNDLRYKTYTSGDVYDIKINSIIDIQFANSISIILKFIFKLRKVEKKNVRNKTSNRKFNDDSYDISREYGRC